MYVYNNMYISMYHLCMYVNLLYLSSVLIYTLMHKQAIAIYILPSRTHVLGNPTRTGPTTNCALLKMDEMIPIKLHHVSTVDVYYPMS